MGIVPLCRTCEAQPVFNPVNEQLEFVHEPRPRIADECIDNDLSDSVRKTIEISSSLLLRKLQDLLNDTLALF